MQKRGFVGVLNRAFRLAQNVRERRQRAVFAFGFQGFPAAPERIVGQHAHAQLLRDGYRVEILSGQKLVFGINLHAVSEIGVNRLTVRVRRIAQRRQRLRQDCVGRHKPYDNPRLGRGQRVENGTERVTGNQSFPAARRDFRADVRDAGKNVLIGRQAAVTDADADVIPEFPVRPRQTARFVQAVQIAGQVRDNLFLIAFQFHVPAPLQFRNVTRNLPERHAHIVKLRVADGATVGVNHGTPRRLWNR